MPQIIFSLFLTHLYVVTLVVNFQKCSYYSTRIDLDSPQILLYNVMISIVRHYNVTHHSITLSIEKETNLCMCRSWEVGKKDTDAIRYVLKQVGFTINWSKSQRWPRDDPSATVLGSGDGFGRDETLASISQSCGQQESMYRYVETSINYSHTIGITDGEVDINIASDSSRAIV